MRGPMIPLPEAAGLVDLRLAGFLPLKALLQKEFFKCFAHDLVQFFRGGTQGKKTFQLLTWAKPEGGKAHAFMGISLGGCLVCTWDGCLCIADWDACDTMHV